MKTKRKSRAHRTKKKNGYALMYDILIIAGGILLAYFLSKAGIIDALVYSLEDYSMLASFIAGIFFTSAFTLAPASIALVHIANHTAPHTVIFWGALGAMCGDLVLLLFIRDKFAADILNVFKPSKIKILFHSLHFGFLKWLSPFVGALIIASPLPDEFGIALLGMSKIRLYLLLPLSFVMNMLGIYALLGFAILIS
jgi:hypothetical protein